MGAHGSKSWFIDSFDYEIEMVGACLMLQGQFIHKGAFCMIANYFHSFTGRGNDLSLICF